ncbi:hypothetical protein [Desulfogranum marinum]|uniref:hypothetical protein n=1 Tax=Desulfogranum marinum TaxID=453220 RepID=UPI001962767E|nr:hypothetical protein [Desulfogranum marinum]MBM9515093.1 hypothetical protein [Desulfogranum marinum]
MNTQHENILYRRGIVLGLTMAEVVILITFCLLLLLANIVGKKNDEIKNLKDVIQQKQEQLEILDKNPNLAADLQKLYRALDKDSFDDAFKELVLIQEKNKSLVTELKSLQEKVKGLQGIQEMLRKNDLSFDDAVNIVESVQEIKKKSPNLLPDQKAIFDLPSKILKLEAEIITKNNRMAYLQNKLERIGKGTEKPACWATPSGKSEYIFEMALTSNGIIIHDNELPHRTVEQAELPLDSVDFSKTLDNQTFRVGTQALYDWSNKNECRFFVKVFDQTKQNEKSIYKKRLRVVGEHFYYFEPTGETSPWLSK